MGALEDTTIEESPTQDGKFDRNNYHVNIQSNSAIPPSRKEAPDKSSTPTPTSLTSSQAKEKPLRSPLISTEIPAVDEIPREVRRNRDAMAQLAGNSRETLIEEQSRATGRDIQADIDHATDNLELEKTGLNNVHHADLKRGAREFVTSVATGYVHFEPELNAWTDQSGSIVGTTPEMKKAAGNFLRTTNPDHPFAKMTEKYDPYKITRENNPYRMSDDPDVVKKYIDTSARIGAFRPFEEEIRFNRKKLQELRNSNTLN